MSTVPPADRNTFDVLIGLQMLEKTPDHVRGRVDVADHHKQPFGLVHGGVMASIAETLASVGTAIAVVPDGNAASGMSNSTSFLRPVFDGAIHADARPRHRGRTTWIWDVEMTDDGGRLCAISRVTIAVRPSPGITAPPDLSASG